MMVRKTLVATVALIGLGGCDDPKAPSNQHFAKALNDHFAKNNACIDLLMFGDVHPDTGNGAAFPAYFNSKPAFGIVNPELKQADALVAAGLLAEKDTVIQQKPMFGSGTQPLQVKSYDLTGAGHDALAKSNTSSQAEIFGNTPHFCYGKPEISKIEQYTEPASMMGVTVSHVSYTYHLTDIASWVRNPAIVASFPAVQQSLADSISGSDDVVLTNNGWAEQHEAMR